MLEVSTEIADDRIFRKMDVLSSKAVFERNSADAEQAIGVLQSYVPEKKGLLASFKGREPLPLKTYEELAGRHNEIMKKAGRLLQLARSVGEKAGHHSQAGTAASGTGAVEDLRSAPEF